MRNLSGNSGLRISAKSEMTPFWAPWFEQNLTLDVRSCWCEVRGRGSREFQVCVAPCSGPLSLLFVVLRASPATPGVSAHPWPRTVAGSGSEIIRRQVSTERRSGVFARLNTCCLSGNLHLSWINEWLRFSSLSSLPLWMIFLSVHLCSIIYCGLKLPQYSDHFKYRLQLK